MASPPPNPNRLARRYMGLLKTTAAQAKDDAALGAKVRVLLAEYEAARGLMIAAIIADDYRAKQLQVSGATLEQAVVNAADAIKAGAPAIWGALKKP